MPAGSGRPSRPRPAASAATAASSAARRRRPAAGPGLAPAAGRSGSSNAPNRPSRTSATSRRRSAGSFARQRRSTPDTARGTSADSDPQAGSDLMTSARMPVTSSPSNALRPVSISYTTAPSAHTSVRRSTGRPRACSGDMYAAVPTMTPIRVAAVMVAASEEAPDAGPASRALARPKSRTLTAPSFRTLTLAGLRSRWITPAPCAASRASAIRAATSRASSRGIGPRAIRSSRVGPSTSSSTSARVPPSSSMPWICATFGWSSDASSSASRWNRARRSGSAAKASGRIFRATSRFRRVSRAR